MTGERVFRPAGAEARLLAASEPLAAGVTAGVVSWEIKPSRTAEYRLSWGGSESAPVRMLVRPAVSLRRVGQSFVLALSAARDYAGRRVLVQRLVRGRWATTRPLTIGPGSRARFSAARTGGRLRVVVPAAFGYAPAISRVVRA
jgi:hypothetical protein